MYENIRLIVLDVDGTLTDAGVYYDSKGNEIKKFSTKDGAGIEMARSAGLKFLVLTGRESFAVKRRMEELKIDFLAQNVKNKKKYLEEFINEKQFLKNEILYIGDDINDLPAMSLAGFIACPYDSCAEVKNIANYVSTVNGGYGAVRDIIEYIMKFNYNWNLLIDKIYGNY